MMRWLATRRRWWRSSLSLRRRLGARSTGARSAAVSGPRYRSWGLKDAADVLRLLKAAIARPGEAAKQRRKARIAALRAEQRREIDQIQAQVRGYEKAHKAVTKGNGREEGQQEERRPQIRA